MTSFEEFLSMLQNRDIKVWAEGEDLRCNAPKGVITPEIREQLVKHKAEILTYLHKENGTSRFRHEPIQPLAGNKNLPLSFAQQRLWFLDQLEGGSSAYNMPAAFQMKGPLHIKGLEQSLTEMVRRHEVLRTVFLQLNGSPIQTINPPETMIIPLIDLQHLSRKEQESKTRRLIAEEAKCPFDLARGPLLRASLLRLDDNSHILLVTMHHIVTDGWSIVIFIKELASLYSAFSKGETISLPELPIQYADYAYWQREVLQGETLETLLDYWKQQLAGAPPLLELPLDRPRPALQSFRGSFIPFELDSLHMDGMKKLSREAGATLFMPLLTAFATLLSRYSGQEDIVVGTPIANRNRAEVEGLIGFFANTLALRIRLSGNPTFRELLDQVRETTIGAYEHQDLPFEKLVEELQPERHLSYNPLVQVVFVLQNIPLNAPTPALKLRGLDLTPMEFDHGTVRMDLEVHLWEVPEGCKGYFIYNTDLFDAATINRMIGHFQSIVKSVSFNPNQFALELSMLTDVERHQLASGWNRTNKDYFQNKCIHTVFEALAEQRPGATAVIYEDKKLSYRELNDRANQLARYLQSRGIGPEVPVAICLERSLEMMVGLLGILKAGGAYVPLDPAYPDDRLTFMLKDSMAPVLLTQQNLVFRLPEIKDQNSENQHPTIICLDRDSDIISKEYTDNLRSGVHSKNLAYIIYTSGSTGKPKGVQVNHDSVVHLLKAIYPLFHFDENDIWTVFHSYAFDFSVWEIWGALLYGCRLVIVPQQMTQSPKNFYELLQREQVTVLNQTPSALYQLIKSKKESTHVKSELSLRHIICGGEDFPGKLASQLIEWKIPLWNFYGPTEATVWTTIHRVEGVKDKNRSVPIGKPITNAQVYLLDPLLQLVPVGIPGELYIGGAGLARGYHNRSELNSEKFIPNPFQNVSDARLYHTGDIARYLPDGTIEYIRRVDHQVKIRGFRIELGEIESLLQDHHAVQESVVIIKEYQQDDKRLIAYVVQSQGQKINDIELRHYLKTKVPEYMVPSVIAILEKMPLSSNGKIDRLALPLYEHSGTVSGSKYEAPRNEVEQRIAKIWQEVLHREKVGTHDNFFDIGGHSLLTTQVQSKLQEIFQNEISVVDLFQHPSIHSLAEFISWKEGTERPVFQQMHDRVRKQKSVMSKRSQHLKQLKKKKV